MRAIRDRPREIASPVPVMASKAHSRSRHGFPRCPRWGIETCARCPGGTGYRLRIRTPRVAPEGRRLLTLLLLVFHRVPSPLIAGSPIGGQWAERHSARLQTSCLSVLPFALSNPTPRLSSLTQAAAETVNGFRTPACKRSVAWAAPRRCRSSAAPCRTRHVYGSVAKDPGPKK